MMTTHRSARSMQRGIVISRYFYYAHGTQDRDATLPICCRCPSNCVMHCKPLAAASSAKFTLPVSYRLSLSRLALLTSMVDICSHSFEACLSCVVSCALHTYLLLLAHPVRRPYDPPWPRLTSASDRYLQPLPIKPVS